MLKYGKTLCWHSNLSGSVIALNPGEPTGFLTGKTPTLFVGPADRRVARQDISPGYRQDDLEPAQASNHSALAAIFEKKVSREPGRLG